jgi:hypothetical protein
VSEPALAGFFLLKGSSLAHDEKMVFSGCLLYSGQLVPKGVFADSGK